MLHPTVTPCCVAHHNIYTASCKTREKWSETSVRPFRQLLRRYVASRKNKGRPKTKGERGGGGKNRRAGNRLPDATQCKSGRNFEANLLDKTPKRFVTKGNGLDEMFPKPALFFLFVCASLVLESKKVSENSFISQGVWLLCLEI